MKEQTTGMPSLLKNKQFIQQIIKTIMGKNSTLYQLLIITFSTFTTTKPDSPPCTIIFSLGVVAINNNNAEQETR